MGLVIKRPVVILPKNRLISVSQYIYFRKTTAPYRQDETQQTKTKFLKVSEARNVVLYSNGRFVNIYLKIKKILIEDTLPNDFNDLWFMRCSFSEVWCIAGLKETSETLCILWKHSRIYKHPVFYGSIPVYITCGGINSYKPTKYL